ncbi:MAG: sugar ABC transporter permease, partial [Candidatus Atribacteria bacterium]|nr:sugar ABC transporter permease [Candidatus Atribacteria bacterium]
MEAARIDGANSVQIFFSITLKLMKKIIMIALLFRTVEAFKAFESIFITTKGGPGYTTRTLNIYSYMKAFEFMKFGESAALAIVMLLVSTFLVTIMRKSFSKEGRR